MEKSNIISSLIWLFFSYHLVSNMVDLFNEQHVSGILFLAIGIQTVIVARDLNRYGIINILKGFLNK